MNSIAYFNVPAFGHIGPSLPIVESLVDQGARVVYYVDEAYQDVVSAAGAESRVMPNFTSMPNGTLPRNIANAALTSVEQIHHGMPFLQEQVAAEGIGLIIHDHMCTWGRALAQVQGIPSVRTCSILVSCDPALPRVRVPMSAILRQLLHVPDLVRFRRLAHRLHQTYGLPRMGIGEALRTRGDLDILFTTRAFLPHSELLDDRYRFVGASISERPSETLPLPQRGERPLIYISLGTLFNRCEDFYRICQAAFAEDDVYVVLSVGRRTDPATLGPWPENFFAAPSVPQLDVLKQASVFISQGGGCSVNESLVSGTPLVMWPQNFEHAFNVDCVVAQGAGVRLEKDDISAEGLRNAALGVLRDRRYQAEAERVGASLIEAGGARRAAEEILAFQRDAAAT